MTPYTPPQLDLKAFNCPMCGAFAEQEWMVIEGLNKPKAQYGVATPKVNVSAVEVVKCYQCKRHSVWVEDRMVYPVSGTAPLPNSDMPAEVLEDYNEARNIVSISPRGAVALLRLGVQKLCKHFGEPGENINTDIGNLVKKGLPEKMQRALDSVRVVGNSAVHPGQIDLRDDVETANKLFVFLNVICDTMITQPKNIDAFYDDVIPDGAKAAIDKRDGKV